MQTEQGICHTHLSVLADCLNRSPTGSLSFFSWNINGIFAKPLGDKLQNNECLNLICQFDFVILCETWKETIIDVTVGKLKGRKGWG